MQFFQRFSAGLHGDIAGNADPALARKLEAEAAKLKASFNSDFWMPERECFALAIDGDGRQVDSITSNIGHLLWSGIVDDDKAPSVVRHLMGDHLFSGWGVRTMATPREATTPSGITSARYGRTTTRSSRWASFAMATTRRRR